jgi:polyhydroxyalkanoate synthesis regulator phasin
MPTKASPTTKVVIEEVSNGKEKNAFFDALHKVMLASIGAVALAQEEIEDFINKLVEKGEIAEKDGRKLVNDIMEKRKKSTEKAEDEFTKRVEEILDRMSVPTKADIEALGEKITALTKKVDDLKKD